MSFTIKARMIEKIINQEISILKLQLGHYHEMSAHRYTAILQRRELDRRRSWWKKSIPEMKKRLEAMDINIASTTIEVAG